VSGSANSSPAPAAESSSDCSSSFGSTPSSTTTKQRDRLKHWHPSPPPDVGVLRRIGACAQGFRVYQRQPAPTERYNRRLRRVFYMAALSSIRANGPSQTFYDRKRGERLVLTQALLALARRLVDVLWALLPRRTGIHPADAHPRHRGGLTPSLRLLSREGCHPPLTRRVRHRENCRTSRIDGLPPLVGRLA